MRRMKSMGWRLGALLAFAGFVLCFIWGVFATMALLNNFFTGHALHLGLPMTTASALGLFMLWPLRSVLFACEHRARLALA